MIKNYIAAKMEPSDCSFFDNAHLTLSFGDTKETQKLSMKKLLSFFPCTGNVIDIVYWPNVNLTVALIDSPEILDAQKYCESVGFNYDLDFLPHVTLCKEDLSNDLKHLKGKKIHFHDVYIRQKDFE